MVVRWMCHGYNVHNGKIEGYTRCLGGVHGMTWEPHHINELQYDVIGSYIF